MEIQVDKEPEYKLHESNVLYDVVKWSRSKQVLNEEQAAATLMVYATGFLPDSSDYGAAYITAGSSGGKTHMKDKVIDVLFALKKEWLFKTTSTSAKGLIDDPLWDDALIAALNEMNKIPDEMMEFLKSVHGDDGGHDYTRNRPDPDSESGFKSVHIGSDAKPYVFMLADENKMEVEAELATRMIEIKMDETEDKNAAVHDMHWGHKNLTLRDVEHEYIFDAPELKYALQHHIANVPLNTPVLIPTGEGRFEGDDWNAAAVTKPMFSFKRSQSTRASRMVSSMVKASAILNYHARNKVMWERDGEMVEHIVVAPEDVGNIISIRKTLMSATHGLDEKKMAVLDAIMEVGGAANREGTALQATRKQIEQAIQENKNISTMGKTEIKKLLEEMNEMYLIDITENPEDRREYLYIYHGGDSLGRPAIEDEWDHFKNVNDPIRAQQLSETIQAQQERLGAKNPADVLTADKAESSGQQTIDATADLSALETELLGMMQDTLQGAVVPAEALDAMEWEHMTGVAPLSVSGDMTTPERPPQTQDTTGTIFDPQHDHWNGHTRGEVRTEIQNAITGLQQKGLWYLEPRDGESYEVVFE